LSWAAVQVESERPARGAKRPSSLAGRLTHPTSVPRSAESESAPFFRHEQPETRAVQSQGLRKVALPDVTYGYGGQ